jgi:peptide/nickel transport system permease protein
MQAYIIRRLLAMVPTLLFASIIVFVTVRLIPGDIIDLMLSSNDIGADKKSRAQLEAALGLDQPMFSQYSAGSAPSCSKAAWASRCGRTPR